MLTACLRILVVAANLSAGLTSASALVGSASEDRSFARHVVMVVKRGANQAGICTGVVIAPQIVLTAAHCLAAPKDMRVVFRDGASRLVSVVVQAVARHPNYRAGVPTKGLFPTDLALIRTQDPLGNQLSAAGLDESGAVSVGESLRIVGYGVNREGEGTSAGVLRSGVLQASAPLSEAFLWADDPNGRGVGGCTGDSGGPILSRDGESVLAITTRSTGVAGRHCGAFTQGSLVAPHRAWIKRTVNRWGG
jgi:Trypsin